MGRLVCAMMDFENEVYSDVFDGLSAYKYIDPDEYWWAGMEEEDEEWNSEITEIYKCDSL
jgi:hypothetical protein